MKPPVNALQWSDDQIAEIRANWQTRSLEDTGRLYRCSPKRPGSAPGDGIVPLPSELPAGVPLPAWCRREAVWW